MYIAEAYEAAKVESGRRTNMLGGGKIDATTIGEQFGVTDKTVTNAASWRAQTKPLRSCRILVLRAGSARSTEFTPAMADDAPFLPGLSPVAGKPVQVTFDAGRLTSDGGVLVLAEIERHLGIAERLARCLEDPRRPSGSSTGSPR